MIFKLGSIAQSAVDEILRLNQWEECRNPKETHCLDYKITVILKRVLQESIDMAREFGAEPTSGCVYTRQMEFVDAVSQVETDGRHCSGAERYREVLKLANNEWMNDLRIITLGIQYRVMRFTDKDTVIVKPE